MHALVGYFRFIGRCLGYALSRSLWAANAWAGFIGATVFSLIKMAFGHVVEFQQTTEAELLKFVVYFGITFVIFFFLNGLFLAPHQIWKKDTDKLQQTIDEKDAVIAEKDAAIAGLTVRPSEAPKVNAKLRALSILIGQGPDFECIRAFSSGVRRRTVFVGVRNTGDGYLTDCRLLIESVSPTRPGFHSFAAFAGPTLLPGQTKYAPVFRFDEEGPRDYPLRDEIVLCERSMGGFLPGSNSLPATIGEATIVTLKATARECGPFAMHVRVWVDTNRKLKVESV